VINHALESIPIRARMASNRAPSRGLRWMDATVTQAPGWDAITLARDAATLSTALLRRAKADGAFDVVAATLITTAAAIVRRERGADALKEMIELAEDPYATD
jgi:hypothetical protein